MWRAGLFIERLSWIGLGFSRCVDNRADGEYRVQQEPTDKSGEPGSFAIEFPLDPNDEFRFTDITINHSVSSEEFPFKAIHGHHADYGEVYLMSSLEAGIIIYNGDIGSGPSNDIPTLVIVHDDNQTPARLLSNIDPMFVILPSMPPSKKGEMERGVCVTTSPLKLG
ncbi:hypothetical protein [Phyllobacterium zundukense]|uniref:Uncharacterized protein n=1 Tax=Phyllobacterium zundukense TaxID=1867719 RepID=A0A2N9W231_9HYPH|nr:hypothetical protein [Phyllobacterium zundukense]ATU91231.1 hypothetical protein BLM14_05985 [Phyllobacterium zundukense]PIO45799.1 hypothetical protein B5P45_04445 [Phyllobacterium zundukense]